MFRLAIASVLIAFTVGAVGAGLVIPAIESYLSGFGL